MSDNAHNVILIIDDDDEFTRYIKKEIQYQFPAYSVLVCHSAADAQNQLLSLEHEVKAAVFDSGFGKNKLAGCDLYQGLIATRPWLESRSVFHTAFDEEVHSELVVTGKLAEDRLIGKSIDSLTNLNAALHWILAP